MNKKKKMTRIKHRKSQDRVKKLLQVSRLKAKPGKIISPAIMKSDIVEDSTKKKSPSKKVSTKKTTTKKTAAKKTTTKKTAAKKTTTKKTAAK